MDSLVNAFKDFVSYYIFCKINKSVEEIQNFVQFKLLPHPDIGLLLNLLYQILLSSIKATFKINSENGMFYSVIYIITNQLKEKIEELKLIMEGNGNDDKLEAFLNLIFEAYSQTKSFAVSFKDDYMQRLNSQENENISRTNILRLLKKKISNISQNETSGNSSNANLENANNNTKIRKNNNSNAVNIVDKESYLEKLYLANSSSNTNCNEMINVFSIISNIQNQGQSLIKKEMNQQECTENEQLNVQPYEQSHNTNLMKNSADIETNSEVILVKKLNNIIQQSTNESNVLHNSSNNSGLKSLSSKGDSHSTNEFLTENSLVENKTPPSTGGTTIINLANGGITKKMNENGMQIIPNSDKRKQSAEEVDQLSNNDKIDKFSNDTSKDSPVTDFDNKNSEEETVSESDSNHLYVEYIVGNKSFDSEEDSEYVPSSDAESSTTDSDPEIQTSEIDDEEVNLLQLEAK